MSMSEIASEYRALACHRVDGESDPVKTPNHYRWHPSGVECKTISMHFPHPVASAIEYLWRAGRKGGHTQHIQDLEKAREWIGIEIERVTALRRAEDNKQAKPTKPESMLE